jgi:hypothetical protein
MSRRMVKLIHADGFFPNNEATALKNMVENLQFVQTSHGMEVANFNLIFPDSEQIFHKVLGERVAVDTKRSGVIRKPDNNLIHFEEFDSSEEWCFMVALENTVVNFFYHTDPSKQMGDLADANARTAFDGVDFNYRNLFEWKIHTNIYLETNQCLFFRPWVFHSLEEGLIQYYRLIADNKFRILVMGIPESCKNSVCEKLQQRFENAIIINSMQQRILNKDIDFTVDGQMRHCYRMLNLARNSQSIVTILNMVCPIPKMREILNSDIVVWVNHDSASKYQELNEMFVPPFYYDIECNDDSDYTIDQIAKKILTKKI